jgi:hypothetical protein
VCADLLMTSSKPKSGTPLRWRWATPSSAPQLIPSWYGLCHLTCTPLTFMISLSSFHTDRGLLPAADPGGEEPERATHSRRGDARHAPHCQDLFTVHAPPSPPPQSSLLCTALSCGAKQLLCVSFERLLFHEKKQRKKKRIIV